MNKFILLALLLMYSCNSTLATNYHITGGARANSMGKSSVTLNDNWGSFNNQAAIAHTSDISLLSYCENRFGLKEFSSILAAIVIPTNKGNFTANITYFGLDIYHEQKVGLGYARMFGDKLSIGLQFDLLSLSIPTTAVSENTFTIEGGLIYNPSDNLTVGFYIFNPTGAKFNDETNHSPVPQIAQLGLSYSLSNNFLLTSELEHSSETELNIKGGLEYFILDWLAIRTGYYDKPQTSTFGLGLNLDHLQIDLTYQFSNGHNRSPGISVLYHF